MRLLHEQLRFTASDPRAALCPRHMSTLLLRELFQGHCPGSTASDWAAGVGHQSVSTDQSGMIVCDQFLNFSLWSSEEHKGGWKSGAEHCM